MSIATLISLAEGAALERADDGDLRLRGPLGEIAVRGASDELQRALAALPGGAAEHELAQLAGADAARLFYYLDVFARRRLLCWTVTEGGAPLATLNVVSAYFTRSPAKIDESGKHCLSRFAYVRPSDGGLLLECPLAHATIRLRDGRVAALLFAMARPATLHELAATAGLDSEAARALVQLLAEAGMLTPEAEGRAETATEIALAQWDFHDLLFHARTRAGRHATPTGATYRFEGDDRIRPLPTVKPPAGGPAIDLFRPDLDELRRADAPLVDVMERRRSIRKPGAAPLTARELGELLFRSARERPVDPAFVDDLPVRGGDAISNRPYPSGGWCYELEIYPIVNRCEGLAPGLYHYCPRAHRLEWIAGETSGLRSLLERGRPWGAAQPPDVLLVVAARFQRVSWRYESIAYSLILKHVGALYQTLYLAATAMGLSPCGIGGGDADLFARLAGTDYYAETSVGEFAISGRCGAAME